MAIYWLSSVIMFKISFTIKKKNYTKITGYNNSHKHYFGQITELDDFINYQELVQRFKNDIKEFITW